jgi:secondary thiamine-phosphate synthase enzyme
MHRSASLFDSDGQTGVHQDQDRWLKELAPHEPVSQYRHNDTNEDNADAHIRRQIMGREVVVAITERRLEFGTWEQIFYGESTGASACS